MAVLLGAINGYSERIYLDLSRGFSIDKKGKEFIVENHEGKRRVFKTRESAMRFVKRHKKRK